VGKDYVTSGCFVGKRLGEHWTNSVVFLCPILI